jgi:ethanolamine utilization protein EutP
MSKNGLANIAIIGEVNAGKSALLDKLIAQETATGKTQAPIFYSGHIVDTPGEFVDNRAWNGALLSTIANVKTVVCLQPANAEHFAVPSGLLRVYPNKHIVSVISKIDANDADIIKATKLLRQNGLPEPYLQISIFDQASIDNLYEHLLALQPDLEPVHIV